MNKYSNNKTEFKDIVRCRILWNVIDIKWFKQSDSQVTQQPNNVPLTWLQVIFF